MASVLEGSLCCWSWAKCGFFLWGRAGGDAPIDGKAQQWEEIWETWEDGTGEGGWEGEEGEDGVGDTGKGVGGMVVSIALEA